MPDMSTNDEGLFLSMRRSLRIVLVFSMIGSGACFLSFLSYGLMLPTLQNMYATGQMSLPGEFTVAFEEMIYNFPQSFFLTLAILYGLSLTGVILMWNLHRIGFHLYTIAQLLVPIATVLLVGRDRLSIGDLMMTLLFVAYYFFALRRLATFTTPTDDESQQEDD
ncbi:MAG: hypothetical protein J6X86_00230 [Bacteroidales bacterium]|nr:hypothetical protein [Bacteroidales bacterium]